jgi:hypothetical protein
VNNFEDKDYIARLAQNPTTDGYDTFGELRRRVFNSFRDPNGTDNNPLPWPWLYGDAADVPVPANSPRQNAAISPTQYSYLALWAAGHFEPDWDQVVKVPLELKDVPVKDQPDMLDRAALEFCLADAFHPGCEVTWPIRHLSVFSKPFRILRAIGPTAIDYGNALTPVTALAPNGPLHAQGPGDLTRWMGLPWQADTAFCQSGYNPDYDPNLPTFWPARVPNYVLTKKNYDVVVNPHEARERRLAAFFERMNWNDALTGTTPEQMLMMLRIFCQMGLLEVLDGVVGDPILPQKMLVAAFGPDVPIPDPPRPAGAAAALSPVDSALGTLRQHALRQIGRQTEADRPFPIHHPEQK